MTAQWEGMGEVGSARYELALLPPCPRIRVLSYSNCQEIHSRQQTGLAVKVLKHNYCLIFFQYTSGPKCDCIDLEGFAFQEEELRLCFCIADKIAQVVQPT